MRCGDISMSELRATTELCSVCGSLVPHGEQCRHCMFKEIDKELEDSFYLDTEKGEN